jgi:hypothetical protein
MEDALSFEDFDCSDVLPLTEECKMANSRTEDYIEDVMIDSALINNMYSVIAECLNTNEANISIEKAEFVRVGGKCSQDYYLLSGVYWGVDGEAREFNKLRFYPEASPSVEDLEGDQKEVINVLLH